MFVTEAMIQEMAERFGQPESASFEIKVSPEEFDRIGRSQKARRNHDITLYVRIGEQWLAIAKHIYPPGLFRAMSGGLEPGESFLDGINREAMEELGCRIALREFLLRTSVEFRKYDEIIAWRSFVFLADYVDGDFRFTDSNEIREVKRANWSDFDRWGEMMRRSTIGGLHYRAQLHERVKPLIETRLG